MVPESERKQYEQAVFCSLQWKNTAAAAKSTSEQKKKRYIKQANRIHEPQLLWARNASVIPLQCTNCIQLDWVASVSGPCAIVVGRLLHAQIAAFPAAHVLHESIDILRLPH